MRFSVIAATLCAAFTFFTGNAEASVTFIGPGSAYDCYMAAEYSQVRPGETAIDVCNLALQDAIAGRELAGTLVNRSVVYIRMGNTTAALADCEAALRIMPTLGEGHANLGVALLRLGRLPEALAALDKSLDYGINKTYVAFYDRGLVREDLGDVKGAYADYKKSSDLKPDFQLAQEQLKRFTILAQSGPAQTARNANKKIETP